MHIEDFKIFKDIPTLKTERLILRKISKNDLDDIFEYSSDAEISKYLLWSPHETKKITKKYLNNILKKYKQGQFFDWAVEFNGKMIGICGFSSIDVLNDKAEAGYIIARAYQGRGFATEALLAVMNFGFEALKLERIECICIEENFKSRAVMKRCGMREEGIRPNFIIQDGKSKNAYVSYITSEDFQKR